MLLILFASFIIAKQEMQRNTLLISAFGFLALLWLIFTTSLTIAIKFLPNNEILKFLIKERRIVGLYGFFFALIHITLVLNFFFRWDIEKAIFGNTYRFIGGIALLLLSLLAITSNNFSMALLKKNWKTLHYLIYIIIILALIHAANIGLIFMKNDYIKYGIILLSAAVLLYKFKNLFLK